MNNANGPPNFDKVKDMLSSFQAKSSDNSSEMEEMEETVLAETNEGKQFAERLMSFCATKWRSYSVSPLLCAQYGWYCQDVSMLKCSRCKVLVNGALPFPSVGSIYEKRLQNLKDKIVNAHHEYCSWKFNPSSESLLTPHIPYSSSKALRWVRDRALKIYEESSPIPDFPIGSSIEIAVDSIGKLVFDNIEKSCSPKQRLALALVLHGWTVGATPNTLGCDFCRREVGLWNFCLIANVPIVKVTEPDPVPSEEVRSLMSEQEETSKCTNKKDQWSKDKLSPSIQQENGDTVSTRTRLRSKSGPQQDGEDTRVSPRRSPRRDSGSPQKHASKSPEVLKIPSRSEAGENTEEKNHIVSPCKRSPVPEGDSPSKRLKSLDIKLQFHPVKEHRSWCTWVHEPPRMVRDKDESARCASEELVQKIQMESSQQDGLPQSTYADPVAGLRKLRQIMSEWSSPIALE